MHTPPQEGPSHAENPPFQHAPPLYCCYTVCLANPQNCHLDMPLSPHIGSDRAQTPTTPLILTLAFGCLFLARAGCRCSIVAVCGGHTNTAVRKVHGSVCMCECVHASSAPISPIAVWHVSPTFPSYCFCSAGRSPPRHHPHASESAVSPRSEIDDSESISHLLGHGDSVRLLRVTDSCCSV